MNGRVYARIGGMDFPIEFGFTITECLGDELDSASIRIPHILIKKDGEYTKQGKILENLKPFDEVILHNCDLGSESFLGTIKRQYGKVTNPNGRFYRHFLVMSPSATAVSLIDGYRNYTISLVSETKGLEKVIMPSRTITQPIGEPGRTVEFFAKEFIERYSPLIKLTNNGSNWYYASKYIPSDEDWESNAESYELKTIHNAGLLTIHEAFGDYRAPETTLSGLGTLRAALTSLFTTRNMIPVVKDGIVFCMDLVRKGNEFSSITGASFFSETMSGDDYCDRLQIGYSGGLTAQSEIHCHEYVGFRNRNASNMRFSELEIEVSYPIYRINRMLMCFFDSTTRKMQKMDITDFVLLDSGRAYLDNDWQDFNNHKPTTVKGFTTYGGEYVMGLADYRFMTVGYSIGSKEITGWGEYLQWTDNGITQNRRTVLQNIFDAAVSYGVGSASDAAVSSDTFISHGGDFALTEDSTKRINAPSVYDDSDGTAWWATIVKYAQNFNLWVVGEDSEKRPDVLKLKTLFFEIDYQGMVSSHAMVSKTEHDGDIMSIDSQQGSMAFFEATGDIEKAKVNRLGNKALVQSARVSDPSNLLAISDYDSENRIVYKRTLAIERDFVSATYYLCKDYVLKNYFSSVASRMRPFAYASYGESVSRLENHTMELIVSDSTQYRDGGTYNFGSSSFSSYLAVSDAVGAFGGKLSADLAYFSVETPNKSLSIYSESDYSMHYYSLDFAVYSHGDSLCITCQMPDSESAGTYIKRLYPTMGKTVSDALNLDEENTTNVLKYLSVGEDPTNDITGTVQDWYMLPKSKSDGAIEDISFTFATKNDEDGENLFDAGYYGEGQTVSDASPYLRNIISLPRIYPNTITYPQFVASEAFKDAKEIISETFQIEPFFEGCDASGLFLKLARQESAIGNGVDVILTASKFGVYGELSPEHWYSTQTDTVADAFATKYGVFRPQGLSISLFGPLGDDGESNLLKWVDSKKGSSPLVSATVDGKPYPETATTGFPRRYTLQTGFYSMEISILGIDDVQDGYIDIQLRLDAKPRAYAQSKGVYDFSSKSDAMDSDGNNFAAPNRIGSMDGGDNYDSPLYGEYLFEGKARMYDADYLSEEFFSENNDGFQAADFNHLYLDDSLVSGSNGLRQEGEKAWLTNPFPNRRQYVLNLIAMPKGTRQKIKGANGGGWVYVPEWSYQGGETIPNDGKEIYGANTAQSGGGIGPVARIGSADGTNATTTNAIRGTMAEPYREVEVSAKNALSIPELPILETAPGNGTITVGKTSYSAPSFLSRFCAENDYSAEILCPSAKAWKQDLGDRPLTFGGNMVWHHSDRNLGKAFPKGVSYATEDEIEGTGLTITDDITAKSVSITSGKTSVDILVPFQTGSIACYYHGEDGLFHFVFGYDIKAPIKMYATSKVGTRTLPARSVKTFYYSLVRDRSKTVYSLNMEPSCKRENYAGKDEEGDMGTEAS